MSYGYLAQRLRQEVDRHGLTMSQVMALGRLGTARLTGLAAGRARTAAVDDPDRGHAGAPEPVARSPHPTERGQRLISLTDSGRAVIAGDRLA